MGTPGSVDCEVEVPWPEGQDIMPEKKIMSRGLTREETPAIMRSVDCEAVRPNLLQLTPGKGASVAAQGDIAQAGATGQPQSERWKRGKAPDDWRKATDPMRDRTLSIGAKWDYQAAQGPNSLVFRIFSERLKGVLCRLVGL